MRTVDQDHPASEPTKCELDGFVVRFELHGHTDFRIPRAEPSRDHAITERLLKQPFTGLLIEQKVDVLTATNRDSPSQREVRNVEGR